MLEIKKSEFNPQEYNRLTLLDTHKNGNETYEYECECDRCEGTGKPILGMCNGKPMHYVPDEGICYKCWGSGKVTQKLKVLTDEQWEKREEKIRLSIKKANENFEQRRQEIIDKHIAEGYKEIDFTIAKWFSYNLCDSHYYRVIKETAKAMCIAFMDKLDDGVHCEHWFPKSAIIKNN